MLVNFVYFYPPLNGNIYRLKQSTCSMMDTQIYVQETFADIPDEFCDADDSSIIIGETIIEVITSRTRLAVSCLLSNSYLCHPFNCYKIENLSQPSSTELNI